MGSQFLMLRGAEPRKILEVAIAKKVPAVVSYLSRGRWHIAKVQLSFLGADRFKAALWPRKRPHPINIQIDQTVGLSFKYEYGKCIFETSVAGLEPSSDSSSGGVLVLMVPERVEMVQRRNFFRVNVPWALKVDVIMWPRCSRFGSQAHTSTGADSTAAARHWQGKLADISAGGAAVIVDTSYSGDFKKGQFVGLKFTPMPYETPLMFNAQIRSTLPTADGSGICLGLQAVGLEASCQGRCVLHRLCNVVERYYQMNQSSAKQQEMQTVRDSAVYN